MRTASLNVHYWSKDGKLNFYALMKEINSELSSMDVLCLQEVLYGQSLDEGISLFSRHARTMVKFESHSYMLPLDESEELEAYLRRLMGFPLDFEFSVQRFGEALQIESFDSPLGTWVKEYQSLPNTPLRELYRSLSLPYMFFAGTANPGFGNAILSRYSFQYLSSQFLHGIQATEFNTRVALSVVVNSPVPFQVICVHLDHLSEQERMVQLQYLLEAYPINNEYCQILCGDLNSLLSEDYNELQIQALRLARSSAGIEEPKFDVMRSMIDSGWVDCAWNAPRPCVSGNVKATCCHGVRIDYILCNYAVASCISNFRIFAMSQTDHSGVFAVFCPVYRNAKSE